MHGAKELGQLTIESVSATFLRLSSALKITQTTSGFSPMAGTVHMLQPGALLACSMRSPLVCAPPCAHARSCTGVQRCRPFATISTVQKIQRRCLTVRAAADAQVDTKEHLQLATAKLPRGMNMLGFTDSLYQWVATLTSSGQNMPFALPIKADKLKNGFQV